MMTTSPYHWCITWFTFTAHWRSTKLSSCLQRDLWVSITHRINKVYITIWHKNRVKPHATAVLSAEQVMKRLHFRYIENFKISTWNSKFYWNWKIWGLEFILIRNKIFILRRSEAVSRDSCQLDIRWLLHDNVGWIEINQIKLSLFIYFWY